RNTKTMCSQLNFYGTIFYSIVFCNKIKRMQLNINIIPPPYKKRWNNSCFVWEVLTYIAG
ncbi:MAG: hypothetical protein RBT13_07145, partial [Bacteroidales bacterium]|nr:hypothetical protein [Bacteroidales bacterium]